MRRSRYSRRASRFVSRKIRKLAHEGVEAPRRVAAALSMARRRGLKVPRKPNVGIAAEGPAEHIRNAMAMLATHRHFLPTDDDTYELIVSVEARLRRALEQLERGTTRLRSNPTLAILGANPRVEDATVATWAKIEYVRTDDPDKEDDEEVVRVHEFPDGFEIAWLTDGSVQLSHPKHKPLWVEEDGT